MRLVFLETAETDATYSWSRQPEAEPFQWVRAFSGRSLESIPPREMMAGIAKALNDINPTAVAITSYSHPDARASLAWCRQHRRTAILMSDSKADDAPRRAWREWVKRVLVSQYDAALVAGSPHAEYTRALGMPSSHVFTPVDVVDNERFANGASQARAAPDAAAESIGLTVDRPYFVAVSRFIPRKNLGTLVRAYGVYRSRARALGMRAWPLVLVGSGPEEGSLRALSREAAEGAVTFVGFRQLDDLVVYLGLAGCLVHPATMDQWGLVVNEAMAAGLPVVVSSSAGCASDLVTDGITGFTFDATDVDGLTQRLVHMAGLSPGERRRMGEAGRRRIDVYRPEDFALALLCAVVAGEHRSERGMSFAATGVTALLRWFGRDSRAFHTIRD